MRKQLLSRFLHNAFIAALTILTVNITNHYQMDFKLVMFDLLIVIVLAGLFTLPVWLKFKFSKSNDNDKQKNREQR